MKQRDVDTLKVYSEQLRGVLRELQEKPVVAGRESYRDSELLKFDKDSNLLQSPAPSKSYLQRNTASPLVQVNEVDEDEPFDKQEGQEEQEEEEGAIQEN